MYLIHNFCLEITLIDLLLYLPRVNELMRHSPILLAAAKKCLRDCGTLLLYRDWYNKTQ